MPKGIYPRKYAPKKKKRPGFARDGVWIVPLTKGFEARVSLEDAERVEKLNWYAQASDGGTGKFYACVRMTDRAGKSTIVGLHRWLLGVEGFLNYVDHEDGDTMNCTRRNLRLASPVQNSHNRTKLYKSGRRAGNSLGVCHVPELNRTNPWLAYINTQGKRKYLGYFPTEVAAATARRNAAKLYHGAFASKL